MHTLENKQQSAVSVRSVQANVCVYKRLYKTDVYNEVYKCRLLNSSKL